MATMATCPQCKTHYDAGVVVCEKDGTTLVEDVVAKAADRAIEPGDVIGEYRIEGKLGEGGFGAVYRAVHPLIGKTAAVKVLSRKFSSDPEIVSRFVAEARAVNQIKHKNIIDIFAFGSLPDGRQYYVMELLEGVTLDRHLDRLGRLAPEEALPILLGIARALDAAHAAGIAHRDLKPENIFLAHDEDRGFEPKLLDFGIAKLFGDPTREHQTRTGVPIGTPYYMSPEQCRGVKVDHRTDVYSFGVLCYRLFTGTLPFTAEATMDVMMQHVGQKAPPMSAHVPSLAPLDAAVARMLAKSPGDRPSTTMEALRELAEAARASGHDVAVPSVKSGRQSNNARTLAVEQSMPKGMTPSEFAALVSADTLAHATTAAADTPSLRTAPRRRWGLVMIGGAIAAAAAIAWMAARPTERSEHEQRVASAAPSAAAPSPAPRPTPTPTPTPAASPSRLREIALTVESVPRDVEVYLGEEKLGVAPGPFPVERGNEPIELELRAKGYVSRKVQFTPKANGVVSATLQKIVRKTRGGAKKPELEF